MDTVILTNMCMIENKETDELLVINRVKNWKGITFVGGHIEDGEPIVPSVIREVKEETGLDVTNLEFIGIKNWYFPNKHERNVVFMFRTSTYSGKLINETEEGKIFWVKRKDFANLKLSAGFKEEHEIFFDKSINEKYSVLKDGKWQNETY